MFILGNRYALIFFWHIRLWQIDDAIAVFAFVDSDYIVNRSRLLFFRFLHFLFSIFVFRFLLHFFRCCDLNFYRYI
ncbi:hypothetical protein A7P25_05990 [Achromobacter xylosoxidans]|nr:hypothetical protein A7P25_05990 [Achromobacter xylosoxidans]